MFKQKNYLALGAVVFVAIVLLSLPTRATAHLKLAIGSWFLPLFGLAGAAQQLPADLADSVLSRRELLHQVDSLRRENQQLKEQQIQTVAIARENDQLRALFNWRKTMPWRLKLAKVVMRDPANWWRTIQIDLGSRDGLTNDLPVITDAGLVGRVSSVSLTHSQVVLVGDPNCRVSALVENAARDMGVLIAGGHAGHFARGIDLSRQQRQFEIRPERHHQRPWGRLPAGYSHRPNRGFPFRRIRALHGRAGETEREPGVARTGLGVVPMNIFRTILILACAFLAVFGEATLSAPRHWLGAQVDLLPALMVYTALIADLPAVALLAVLGGLWFDALSANPLGLSIMPLAVIGWPIYLRRDLILRDLPFAQLVLGAAASALAPALALLLMLSGGKEMLLGWGTLWQWLVMTGAGAVATPFIFSLMEAGNRALGYQERVEAGFRPDREIQRSRRKL